MYIEKWLSPDAEDFWGNPPELKYMTSFSEGIDGIRCTTCGKLVEDYSDTGILCRKHVDNPDEEG